LEKKCVRRKKKNLPTTTATTRTTTIKWNAYTTIERTTIAAELILF
jgi:hypothetical protein